MNMKLDQTNPELQIVASILADIRMEGFKFTAEEETLFHKIGNGEIGVEEARQNYLFKIEKLSEERPEIFYGAAESDVVGYLYPETNVLLNNFGINNWVLLQEAERNLTGFRMIEHWRNPIQGKFDFDYLKAIHYQFFQDLFPWAGKTRNVDIGKGGHWFCRTECIESYQQQIFGRLKKKDYLQGLEPAEFAKDAADFLGDLNALHPFREGNGRTQREFLRQLAIKAGYRLNFSDVSQEYMIFASRESFDGNNKEFERIIKNRLTYIE